MVAAIKSVAWPRSNRNRWPRCIGIRNKVVWGSRYPQHDTTSAHDALVMLTRASVPDDIIARMMGGNAAEQFGVRLLEPASG
jgi:hypothetical protein